MTRFASLLFAAPVLGLAQYNYGSSSTGTKTAAMATSSPTSTSSGGSTIHSISVGQGGLKFSPDSITAKVGDQVEFHFASTEHTVTEGAFNNACQPKDASAFFSANPKSDSVPFTITVNTTDPMWFYCSEPGHCQAGMVGVINPPSGQTVAEFAAAAAKTSKSTRPSNVQGGVFANAKPASGSTPTQGSSTSSSSAAASPTSSPGAAPGQLLLESLGMSLPLGILGYVLL